MRLLPLLGLLFLASAAPAQPAPETSAVEPRVAEMVKQPGATVVHLWATWCPNCAHEFKEGGWQKFVEANPKVRFVFVTFWNDGNDGRALLEKNGIGAQPNVTILAHPGPRKGDGKATAFLGTPVTWLPSTWVFDQNKLKFALNYGELRFPILQQLLEDAQAKW